MIDSVRVGVDRGGKRETVVMTLDPGLAGRRNDSISNEDVISRCSRAAFPSLSGKHDVG